MLITFYNNKSENNAISKNIAYVTSKDGSLINETNIIDVDIMVEGDTSILTGTNYMYIDDFKRYYFITDINIKDDTSYSIKGHVDVLMTYANEIKKQRAVIAKQENRYNLLLNDTDYKSYENSIITQRKFPNGFTEHSTVMLTGY